MRYRALTLFILSLSSLTAQSRWARLPAMPTRGHAVAHHQVRGETWLFGGQLRSGALSADSWYWTGGVWRRSPVTGPGARIGHVMVYDKARAQLVLFGGYDGSQVLADTWVFDGERWLARTATGPSPRQHHAMTYDERRSRVVLFGGRSATTDLADTWEWDGTNWASVTTAAAPSARGEAGLIYDNTRGIALLFGGSTTAGLGNNEHWTYNGVNWTQRTLAVKPPARAVATMVFDELLGQALLFGGRSGTQMLGDTWVWSGTAWQLQSVIRAPAASDSVRGTFDPVLLSVIAYGGDTSTSETWSFSVGGWLRYDAHAEPDLGDGCALVYDRARGRSVLFGGAVGTGLSGATWEFDGDLWRRVWQTGPVARRLHAMAYDEQRGATLLFGGEDSNGSGLDDTWTWDGGTWRQQVQTTRPPRGGGAMVFDAQRAVAVLLTNGTTTVPMETWEWNGVAWSARTGGTVPPPRRGHRLAYDRGRGVVMFGGEGTDRSIWRWDGSDWLQTTTSVQPPATKFHGLCFDPVRARLVCWAPATPADRASYEWDGSIWRRRVATTTPDPQRACVMVYENRRGRAVAYVPGEGSWEYVACCDVVGAASASSVPLTCDTDPRIGSLFCVTLANPDGNAAIFAGPAPALPRPFQLDLPALCERMTLFVDVQLLVPFASNPAQLCIYIPLDPTYVGLGITLQGIRLVGSCFRGSDAITITVQR